MNKRMGRKHHRRPPVRSRLQTQWRSLVLDLNHGALLKSPRGKTHNAEVNAGQVVVAESLDGKYHEIITIQENQKEIVLGITQ